MIEVETTQARVVEDGEQGTVCRVTEDGELRGELAIWPCRSWSDGEPIYPMRVDPYLKAWVGDDDDLRGAIARAAIAAVYGVESIETVQGGEPS